MSSKIKVELNSSGIRKLLRSDDMENTCLKYANKAVQQLGPGYEASSYKGQGRVNASVAAVTPEAIAENEEDNRVIKAVLSSR